MTRQEGIRIARKFPKTIRIKLNEDERGNWMYSIPHPENREKGIRVFSEGDVEAEYKLVRVVRTIPAEEDLEL